MDDGGSVPVEVGQASGHVAQDRKRRFLWQGPAAAQTLGERAVEELHHQRWEESVSLDVYSNELDDVRVAESSEQLTFLCERLQHVPFLLCRRLVVEKAVDLLSGAL